MGFLGLQDPNQALFALCAYTYSAYSNVRDFSIGYGVIFRQNMSRVSDKATDVCSPCDLDENQSLKRHRPHYDLPTNAIRHRQYAVSHSHRHGLRPQPNTAILVLEVHDCNILLASISRKIL